MAIVLNWTISSNDNFVYKEIVMKKLIHFILKNGLKQADAIVLRKKLLGMVDHYAIFMGFRNGSPVFLANYRSGVKEVTFSDMQSILATLEPKEIEPFKGSENERQKALNRAWSRLGENSYNYTENNCEHFKNYVHHGKDYSDQVKIAADVTMGTAALVGVAAIATKSPKAGLIAAGLLLLGLYLNESSKT